LKRGTLFLIVMLACMNVKAQELRSFVRGSQQSIKTSHKGKPFMLALWSLDCTHCIDDMALLGTLSKKYRNLDIVLVSTDAPENKPQLVDILHRYHLEHAESWVFADDYAERLRFEVDPQWYGELPRTYFFDATGQASAMSGKIDGAQVERWIVSQRKR
jgi:thiol-disulfide isomerase/thioredoxin